MARKITKRNFLKMSPAEISRMVGKEARELLRGVRQLFTAQQKTLEKYSQKVYSPAYQKMMDYYSQHGTEKLLSKKGGIEQWGTAPRAASDLSVNQVKQELFRLQEFFESKTSTVPGARKVTKEMGARIFGTDEKGNPKHKLDVEQWAALWSLYEEYKRSRPQDAQENSDIVQQAVGQVIIDAIEKNSNIWLSSGKIQEVADLIQNYRDSSSWEMKDYNDSGKTVLSGTRSY